MHGSLLLSCLLSCLVSQLGNPSFPMREKSHAALSRLLPLSLPALQQATRSDDVETAVRAGQLVKWHYQDTAHDKAAKAKPKDYPYLPWIDRLPKGYPDRQAVIYYWLAQVRIQGNYGGGAPHWEDYRLATRLFIEELYADPLTAGKVQSLLDGMVKSEILWIVANATNYNPPLKLP